MTGPGRPRKGPRICVRLAGEEQLARVDTWASARDIRDRAEAIRQLIDLGLLDG